MTNASPRKHNYRNYKKKFRKGKKPFARSSDRHGQVMVNRTPARMHNIIAPHYYTRLESGFTGVLKTAMGVTAGQFSISGNDLNVPFNDNSLAFSSIGGSALVPATLALNALNPVGFTQLSTLYQGFRVFASKITVTMTPSAGADALVMVLSPYTTSSGAPALDTQLNMSQPYAKAITCTGSNNVKQNTLSSYIDSATILGLTRQQYKDDPTTGLSTSSALTAKTSWNVAYQLFSGSAPSANIAVECRITYWVEFIDPVNSSATDV